MDWQLLILTYPPDLNWLDVCLRSVKKYVDLVHRPLVIATPECQGVMPESSAGCEIVYEPQNADHHRGQVYIKMNADKYIESELVFITDSDCLFTRKCSVDDFCHDGKPIVNMEAYSDLIPTKQMGRPELFLSVQNSHCEHAEVADRVRVHASTPVPFLSEITSEIVVKGLSRCAISRSWKSCRSTILAILASSTYSLRIAGTSIPICTTGSTGRLRIR